MQQYCIYDILGLMPKYEYTKFNAGPLPFRIDDPQIETANFDEAISHLQKRKDGTITANAVVPIDTDVYVTLTKEQMAGKTRAQILKMFDDEIDGKLERLKSLPAAYQARRV
jgi:hypothetical protein